MSPAEGDLAPSLGSRDPGDAPALGGDRGQERHGPRRIVGLDLGTAFCRVAAWEGTRAVTLPNALGALATPTAVAFPTSGRVLVGQEALDHGDPATTIRALPRFVGQAWDRSAEDRARWPGPYVRGADGGVAYAVHGEVRDAVDVLAVLLAHLRADAAAALGASALQAVVAMAGTTTPRRRQAVQAAGRRAELPVTVVFDASVAALVATVGDDEADREVVLVDVGAGWTQAVRAATGDGLVEIVAVARDAVVRDVRPADAALGAAYAASPDGRPPLDRLYLAGAGLTAPIAAALRAQAGPAQVVPLGPDAAAHGAAIRAGIHEGVKKDVLLLDVEPLAVAVEDADGLAEVLVAANTTIPTSQTVRLAFEGAGRPVARLVVGPREVAADNMTIAWIAGRYGWFRDADLTIDIDALGRYHATLRDRRTGEEVRWREGQPAPRPSGDLLRPRRRPSEPPPQAPRHDGPFWFLARFDPAVVVEMLDEEALETAAAVIAHLDPAYADGLLAMMAPDRQAAIILALRDDPIPIQAALPFLRRF